MSDMRVGIGSDVHAFAAETRDDKPLMVAGLAWDGPALEGHSDGDVAAHAACDAILSAAQCGDLGGLVGVDRPEWDGASGVDLLRAAVAAVGDAGWRVVNVSVQVIGTRPRIGTRRDEAQRVLSEAVGAPVSVSGTTSDGLGFTGRGEGLAAIATALVTRL